MRDFKEENDKLFLTREQMLQLKDFVINVACYQTCMLLSQKSFEQYIDTLTYIDSLIKVLL